MARSVEEIEAELNALAERRTELLTEARNAKVAKQRALLDALRQAWVAERLQAAFEHALSYESAAVLLGKDTVVEIYVHAEQDPDDWEFFDAPTEDDSEADDEEAA